MTANFLIYIGGVVSGVMGSTLLFFWLDVRQTAKAHRQHELYVLAVRERSERKSK